VRGGYLAFAPLAGGSCDMRSLVGFAGRLIGMLSGLLEPPAPDAASGGLAIGAWLSGGALDAVCATALAPLASSAASAAAVAVNVAQLPRFMSFSFDVARLLKTRGCVHVYLVAGRVPGQLLARQIVLLPVLLLLTPPPDANSQARRSRLWLRQARTPASADETC
jgi:hypothetical protein